MHSCHSSPTATGMQPLLSAHLVRYIHRCTIRHQHLGQIDVPSVTGKVQRLTPALQHTTVASSAPLHPHSLAPHPSSPVINAPCHSCPTATGMQPLVCAHLILYIHRCTVCHQHLGQIDVPSVTGNVQRLTPILQHSTMASSAPL